MNIFVFVWEHVAWTRTRVSWTWTWTRTRTTDTDDTDTDTDTWTSRAIKRTSPTTLALAHQTSAVRLTVGPHGLHRHGQDQG